MVGALISVLIGAGTSFAPLYIDIQGGAMRHVMCPWTGGRPDVPDAQGNGLCVTPLPWFFIVGALCLALSCCLALFHECAKRFVLAGGMPGDGAVTSAARRPWFGALACVIVGMLVFGLPLGLLTGAAWLGVALLVIVIGMWMQMVWNVAGRLGLSPPRWISADLSAAVWGGAIALLTQLLESGRLTFSGGVTGAVVAACCSLSIRSMGDGTQTDDGGLCGVFHAAPLVGALSFAFAFVLTVGHVRSWLPASGGARTLVFSSSEVGGLIETEWGPHTLSVIAISACVVSLIAGISACVLAAWSAAPEEARRRWLVPVLYALAGLCLAVAFVIGFTLA